MVFENYLLLLSVTEEHGMEALENLRSVFLMKDLREVSYYLECRIICNLKAPTVTFDQRPYVKIMGNRFGVWKPRNIPVSSGASLPSKFDRPRRDA